MQVQINQSQNNHALADAGTGGGDHPIVDRRQSTGRPDVTIRLALNEDGPAVGVLVEQLLDGVDLGEVDWSEVNPNWLVAEVDGRRRELQRDDEHRDDRPRRRRDLLRQPRGSGRRRPVIARDLTLTPRDELRQSGRNPDRTARMREANSCGTVVRRPF